MYVHIQPGMSSPLAPRLKIESAASLPGSPPGWGNVCHNIKPRGERGVEAAVDSRGEGETVLLCKVWEEPSTDFAIAQQSIIGHSGP